MAQPPALLCLHGHSANGSAPRSDTLLTGRDGRFLSRGNLERTRSSRKTPYVRSFALISYETWRISDQDDRGVRTEFALPELSMHSREVPHFMPLACTRTANAANPGRTGCMFVPMPWFLTGVGVNVNQADATQCLRQP